MEFPPLDETNNRSVGLLLTFGKTRFLFTGDAEEESERAMLELGVSLEGHNCNCTHGIRAVYLHVMLLKPRQHLAVRMSVLIVRTAADYRIHRMRPRETTGSRRNYSRSVEVNLETISFYDAKPYDKLFFDKRKDEFGFEINYYEDKLNRRSALMAEKSDFSGADHADGFPVKIKAGQADQTEIVFSCPVIGAMQLAVQHNRIRWSEAGWSMWSLTGSAASRA